MPSHGDEKYFPFLFPFSDIKNPNKNLISNLRCCFDRLLQNPNKNVILIVRSFSHRRPNLTNARIFLDLYNNLEELLKAKYTTPDRRQYSNVVLRFANDDEGRRWREELDLCREIRNMLSHHSRFDGEDIFQPADSLISLLREIVNFVEHPPVAMSVCTRREQLLTCERTDRVSYVVKRMNDAGFSHVPILSGRTLAGVFSAGTMLSYIEKYGAMNISKDTPISALSEFLSVFDHKNETYNFVDANATFGEIRAFFVPVGPNKLRTSAVFVTRGGKPRDELLGIITPWDMIREAVDKG